MDDIEVLEAPVEEAEIDQPSIEEPEPEEKPEPKTEEKFDARRVNSEWSKRLKLLREQFPEDADMLSKLRDGYGRYSTLQTDLGIKSVEDIRQWKATLDSLGGTEAAADLLQRVADVEHVDAKIEAGDFSVVSDLPETMQKGFYQMIPDALNHLAENDEKAFNAAVMPHFAAALQGTGMGDHLKKMYAIAGDNEPIKELIRQQYDWFQSKVQGQGSMGGAKAADPQVQRLQAELETRRQADDQSFIGKVTETTDRYMQDAFSKSVDVYVKQFNLADDQKSDLMDSFGSKMAAKLGADTAFQKQLAAYKGLKNRNVDTVNAYVRSKVDENAKAIIDGLVTARYGGQRVKPKTVATATATTSNGATRVAKAPDQSQWDMAKMEAAGYEATAKRGLFYLQGGRTVQVIRPS